MKMYPATTACAALCAALLLGGCSEDTTDPDNDLLNIDYAALFVINGQNGNVSVVDLAQDAVTETISLNGARAPHHVYLSPDYRHMAIAVTDMDLSGGHGGHGGGGGDFKVQIVSTTTGAILREIALDAMPHNAIYSPDGSELWIGQASEPTGKVLVYRTSDYSLTNSIEVGMNPSEVTFTPDGSMAFVANTGDNSVTIIDRMTKMVHATIDVGDDPVGAWPASNGKMYVDNEASGTVSEIDPETMEAVATINLGFMPGYVAYRASADELWVSDATNGNVAIYTRVSDAWALQQTIPTGPGAHAIVFTANEAKAYVTNQEGGTVSVIDAAGRTKIKDIPVGPKPNGMAIKEG